MTAEYTTCDRCGLPIKARKAFGFFHTTSRQANGDHVATPVDARTLVRLPVQAGSREAFEGRRFGDKVVER